MKQFIGAVLFISLVSLSSFAREKSFEEQKEENKVLLNSEGVLERLDYAPLLGDALYHAIVGVNGTKHDNEYSREENTIKLDNAKLVGSIEVERVYRPGPHTSIFKYGTLRRVIGVFLVDDGRSFEVSCLVRVFPSITEGQAFIRIFSRQSVVPGWQNGCAVTDLATNKRSLLEDGLLIRRQVSIPAGKEVEARE